MLPTLQYIYTCHSMILQAVIAYNGELTPNYKYIEDLRKPK